MSSQATRSSRLHTVLGDTPSRMRMYVSGILLTCRKPPSTTQLLSLTRVIYEKDVCYNRRHMSVKISIFRFLFPFTAFMIIVTNPSYYFIRKEPSRKNVLLLKEYAERRRSIISEKNCKFKKWDPLKTERIAIDYSLGEIELWWQGVCIFVYRKSGSTQKRKKEVNQY